mmetsp:Transcript_30430/g.59687  ORF Transcript_30430/g.59687 Transcript_30430/m.59687 type:complete len:205 (-) Transcript_30430:1126-1740(-)
MTHALAVMGMRAIYVTALPSSSTTQTFYVSDCATRPDDAHAASFVPLPMLDRNFLCHISWNKKRRNLRRSSLPTGSRRSGVPLADHTTGKTASTRTHTAIGDVFLSLATHRIHVHGGQIVWPEVLLKQHTPIVAHMAWRAPWLTVPRSNSITPSFTRPVHAATLTVGEARCALSPTESMMHANYAWRMLRLAHRGGPSLRLKSY